MSDLVGSQDIFCPQILAVSGEKRVFQHPLAFAQACATPSPHPRVLFESAGRSGQFGREAARLVFNLITDNDNLFSVIG